MESRKHHYIPKCYLKAWTGADGWLCDYQRPHQAVAVARRHPSATGWIDGLYAAKSLRPEQVEVMEKEFFLRVDQEAADVLSQLRARRTDLSEKHQIGLTRFLMSLLHRHPARIEQLWVMAEEELSKPADIDPAEYLALKGAEDPPTAEEYLQRNKDAMRSVLFARVVQQICESDSIGNHLMKMSRRIVLPKARERLMTSDRPLLLTGGLADPGTVLLLPIAPHMLFVATNGPQGDAAIDALARRDALVGVVNEAVLRQAYRHGYGVCENHRPLAEANLGLGLPLPWSFVAEPG